MDGLQTTIDWYNGSVYVSCTQFRRTVEELKVTTQHGVLKSAQVTLTNQLEQAGHVEEFLRFLSVFSKNKAFRKYIHAAETGGT